MRKKITIITIAAAVLISVVLAAALFSMYRFDQIDEALDHIRQSRDVATYFEKEQTLRVGQTEEYKLFRISKEDFEKLCNQLEPDSWKAEELFTAKTTGKVWILYGPSFPPFTDWMKAHEKEAAAEVNRLIWRYRGKRFLLFLGIAVLLLIIFKGSSMYVRMDRRA